MSDKEQKKNTNKNEDKVEKLKSKLYSKNSPSSGHKEGKLSKKEHNVNTRWKKDDNDESFQGPMKNTSKGGSFLNKFLIFSLAFFVLAAGYALFSLQGGEFSPKKINISVSGPITVAAGDTISLEVEVENNNEVPLERADLIIEYPEGTREPGNTSKELQRYRTTLGNIGPGDDVDTVVEAALFGQEGDTKEITISLEYGIPDSNAVLIKDRTYEVQIDSSPISASISMPEEVNSGEEVEAIVNITANSEEPVQNVLMKLEYPFGFAYQGADPEPAYDQSVWRLGTIQPGSERTIRINGNITGQENEERVFNYTFGIEDAANSQEIGSSFFTQKRGLTIRRPFIGLDLVFNRDADGVYAAEGGSSVSSEILWENNLPVRISDGRLRAYLSGDMIIPESISAKGGFYRSSDDTLLWDSRSDDELEVIDTGETGSLAFRFDLLDTREIAGTKTNPEVLIGVEMNSRRLGETSQDIPQNIRGSVQRKIKVITDLSIDPRIVYHVGPFENSGPMPPEVEERTTYTVILPVSNTVNRVNNVRVSAELPQYVDWIGKTETDGGANLRYNAVSGRVTWDIGDVEPGVGYTEDARTAAFQIAFTPGLAQRDRAPELLRDIKVEGTDNFTNVTLEDMTRLLTTDLKDDPEFNSDHKQVH